MNLSGSKTRPPRVWRGLPTAILLSVLLIGGSTAAGKLSGGAKDAPTNLSITGPGPTGTSAPVQYPTATPTYAAVGSPAA